MSFTLHLWPSFHHLWADNNTDLTGAFSALAGEIRAEINTLGFALAKLYYVLHVFLTFLGTILYIYCEPESAYWNFYLAQCITPKWKLCKLLNTILKIPCYLAQLVEPFLFFFYIGLITGVATVMRPMLKAEPFTAQQGGLHATHPCRVFAHKTNPMSIDLLYILIL